MTVVTVVGARPQFVKAAALGRALARAGMREILIHTGQHYDRALSDVFFEELEIRPPDHNLGVGSGPHGQQTGEMLARVETILAQLRPDVVVVHGDTNSTLAGALAAAKLHIPVAHVEAGLRSFDRAMPEELNRVVTDHLSDLRFAPSATAVANLAREGITRGVHQVGDVMADVLAWAAEKVGERPTLERLGVTSGRYLVATIHRAESTDQPERLRALRDGLEAIEETVLLPLHPRTREALRALGLELRGHVRVIEPLGYLDMVRLVAAARLVLTDSGGLQKEAYWLGVPCLTLRTATEWTETVTAGWNRLVGTDAAALVAAVRDFAPPAERPELYGDGRAAERIVAALAGARPASRPSGVDR